ncbi:L-lysine 6-transaminase [Actinoplanes sichuanensis]|uniref:L-lysine-epsilon aminotransferase n=1 Tax=Actinoplanes sichuanensis TaxID=512349 RepID=A0ABW4AMT7_9ACTN|nr:L-lysine 6-transaminase [Actinoplanes sichuanensis]BEL08265.1 L-lysine 6-transaminase [Actinoplanes sichuanensis]
MTVDLLSADLTPETVDVLRRHVTGDFYDLVISRRHSSGSWIVDDRTGRRYLDMVGFYASSAIGHNHPRLTEDAGFLAELQSLAGFKPSNPDFPTDVQARFTQTLLRVLGDPELPYLLYIDGGALAVENALKVAFDWKTRHNGRRGVAVAGWRVLHLERAFHGRSGYTLSLTNTDPAKTALYPAFDWPRIPSPAVNDTALWADPELTVDERAAITAAEAAFRRHPDEIACFIAEPIQCEGGDRHLRPAFLLAMQELCHRHDALFVLDEVQTGCGVTGVPWLHQELGLAPDLVAFGKKTQVCGVMGGRRVLDEPLNAMRTPSRLSSTFGGNLIDMLRATRILEVIEEDRLMDAAATSGAHLLGRLREVAADFKGTVDDPRGRGLLCAVDLVDGALRDRVVEIAREKYDTLFVGAGERTLRFRPALTVTVAELDEAVDRMTTALSDALTERGTTP